MSEARKAFESHVNQYDTFGDEWQDKGVDEHFIAGYEAGKAARAGQESEPFAFCFTDVNGKPIEFCDHPKHAAEGDALIRTPLYTHPASAQAPEEIERDGINSTENLAYIDGYNDCAKEVRENARPNKQAVSVPEWIKCSDKMPKINSPVVVARISDNDGKPCLDSGVAALQPNNGWVGLGVFYRPKIDAGTIYQNDLSVMDVTHWMPLPDPPKQEQSHE